MKPRAFVEPETKDKPGQEILNTQLSETTQPADNPEQNTSLNKKAPLKSKKAPKAAKRLNIATRQSTRTKKPPDKYQAAQ